MDHAALRVLRVDRVCELLGVSRTWLWRAERRPDSDFPKRVRLGPNWLPRVRGGRLADLTPAWPRLFKPAMEARGFRHQKTGAGAFYLGLGPLPEEHEVPR